MVLSEKNQLKKGGEKMKTVEEIKTLLEPILSGVIDGILPENTEDIIGEVIADYEESENIESENEWKQKYNELKQKYIDRFMGRESGETEEEESGETGETEEEESGNETLDDILKEEE